MSAVALERAIERAFHDERTAVLATLIRYTGDFDLAEEALQDAFASALGDWADQGVPASPGAWLTVTARRRAIDRLRRGRAQAARAERLAELLALDSADHADGDAWAGGAGPLADDRLRLMFTCCHPALDADARVALTLRAVGGLTTAEIAGAFLVAEPTMGKRIVRAKRRIADAQIPYAVPSEEELPERLGGVLQVAYLIFNEGYAPGAGPDLTRPDLCGEAIRLVRLLAALLPGEAEVWGLLALMLLHDARREARVDARGGYVELARQDCGRWDHAALNEALGALDRALALDAPGRFQLHAAIAALHVGVGEDRAVDWPRIAQLYGALARYDPSPAVEVNRAAAMAFATEDPQIGLALLAPLLADPKLVSYQPLAATHAELLRRAGDVAGAREAYGRAIALAGNDVTRAELRRRLAALPVHGSGGVGIEP